MPYVTRDDLMIVVWVLIGFSIIVSVVNLIVTLWRLRGDFELVWHSESSEGKQKGRLK